MARWGRVLVLVGASAILLSSCDWAHYRGGPTLTGVSQETTLSVANVSTLVQTWQTGWTNPFHDTPVVANGRVYTSAGVYGVAGASCPGTPPTCEPLWSPSSAGYVNGPAAPLVAQGSMFLQPEAAGGTRLPTLSVFDAAGVTNCAGNPKVCEPTWTARTTGYPPLLTDAVYGPASPVVDGGRLYATGQQAGWVFDAAGQANCSGVPKVCAPLWRMSAGWPTAPIGVHDGTVFFNGASYLLPSGELIGGLFAYDATGNANCSGTPKSCLPLWRGDFGPPGTAVNDGGMTSTPIVNGVVYAVTSDHRLLAFAEHPTNCVGAPTAVCPPLWSAPLPDHKGVRSELAVWKGRVYVPNALGVLVFDAAGATNCSGAPKVCAPIASFAYPSDGFPYEPTGGVTIENGVAFAATKNGLYAFDADLAQGCSGTPAVCAPIWQALVGATVLPPAFANGRVHVSASGSLVTFARP